MLIIIQSVPFYCIYTFTQQTETCCLCLCYQLLKLLQNDNPNTFLLKNKYKLNKCKVSPIYSKLLRLKLSAIWKCFKIFFLWRTLPFPQWLRATFQKAQSVRVVNNFSFAKWNAPINDQVWASITSYVKLHPLWVFLSLSLAQPNASYVSLILSCETNVWFFYRIPKMLKRCYSRSGIRLSKFHWLVSVKK